MANAASQVKSGKTKPNHRGAGQRRNAKKKSSRRVDIHPLDRAITELRNALARSPDDALLYGRLGALQYRRGDLHEAEGSYRRALQLHPGRASIHNNLGNVLCDLSRMKEGIACYEQAIALEQSGHPEKVASRESQVNLELARLEYRLIHERIDYLEAAVNLDVESADALNALGGGYILCQQREKALSAFRRASWLNPRNVHAARNIAFTHASEMVDPDALSDALAEVAQCAVRFPGEARLFIHEGELLESAGLIESAEEKYLRAIKADPGNLEAYDLLGRIRELNGALDIEDETAREVAATLKRIGGGARKPGKSSVRKATVGASLNSAIALLAQARFTRRPLEDRQEVETLLQETMERADLVKARERDAAVTAAALFARHLEADGRVQEAMHSLHRMSEKAPHAARLWFERGGLAYRQGDIEFAVKAFEHATLLDPQEATAYQSLRFAFEGYRKYKTESVRFEYAIQIDPGDALAYHHMGTACLSVLKNAEAHVYFAKALSLDERFAEAACGCGRALHRLGNLNAAAAAFQRALRIDADCKEAHVALQQLARSFPNAVFLQDSSKIDRSTQRTFQP